MAFQTKELKKIYDRAWREKNRDKIRLQQKRFKDANKEKLTKYAREYARKLREEDPEKIRQYQRVWYRLNPAKAKHSQRKADLKRKFGISLDDYQVLFVAQNGNCAICEINQSLVKRNFAVDHNHETGAIRALLCDVCNLMIGNCRDENIQYLSNAIVYLNKWNIPKKK